MILTLAILFGLFLAYANGANDNFKGVATLYGSGTTSYKRALLWATVTTFLGSTMALILAQELLTIFTGKGLIPDSIVILKSFSLAVVLAAAATVMLATRIGIPISTTHALTGALMGAGWLASPEGVNLARLGSSRQIVGTKIAHEAREALEGYQLPIFKSYTSQRVIYANSATTGSTVLDADPEGPAAQEIRTLLQEVMTWA